MKKILLSLAAAAALAAAVTPAAAQPWRGYDSYDRYDRGYGYHSSSEIRAQEWRIRNAVQQGRISRGQARQLFDELNQLRPLAWRLENGRGDNWEYQELARGLGHVQAGLNVYASRNEEEYGYGGDWRR